MIRMKGFLALGTALVITALAAACAQPPLKVEQAPDNSAPVWPQAGQAARIRYLFSVTRPQDILAEKSLFDRAIGFIRGSKDQPIVSPYGLAVDPEGRLFVVDSFYKAVHVFDTVRGRHYLFPVRPVEGFVSPLDVALGSDGRVYVSDIGSNRVHVFTDRGRKYRQSINGDQFERPTGLAVNPVTGELLVLDTPASKLVVYDEQSLAFRRVVGRTGAGADGFNYPTNVTAAKDGLVYITDSLNFRVQALTPGLAFTASFGSAGDGPGHFSRPKGIATDSAGHVYVVDALFDNVQVFDDQGRLLLAFGGPGSGNGEFWMPNAIFIDTQDRIWVSDSNNHRVQVFQYLEDKAEQP